MIILKIYLMMLIIFNLGLLVSFSLGLAGFMIAGMIYQTIEDVKTGRFD